MWLLGKNVATQEQDSMGECKASRKDCGRNPYESWRRVSPTGETRLQEQRAHGTKAAESKRGVTGGLTSVLKDLQANHLSPSAKLVFKMTEVENKFCF